MSRDIEFDPAKSPFDPTGNDINKASALLMAAASNLSYEDEPLVRETVAKWQFEKFRFFDSKDKDDPKFDTQGFVAANDKAVLVAFRGTENFTDWRTNVKFKPEKGPVGKLHRGFYRAAQRAWDDCIAPAVSEFRNNEQSLWICGHSLGGALALATAALLEFGPDASIKPKAVYTFGQPRVGNRQFARAFNENFGSRAYRFVNNNDIVPHIPPIGWLFQYMHTEKCYYIDAKGKFHPNIPLWKQVLNGAVGAIKDIGNPGPDALNDHSMDQYIKLIRDNFNP